MKSLQRSKRRSKSLSLRPGPSHPSDNAPHASRSKPALCMIQTQAKLIINTSHESFACNAQTVARNGLLVMRGRLSDTEKILSVSVAPNHNKRTIVMSNDTIKLGDLLALVKKESALMSIAKIDYRGGCKFCGCFLSLHREQPTGFHRKNVRGLIEYVIVYHGKTFCRACHKFQVE